MLLNPADLVEEALGGRLASVVVFTEPFRVSGCAALDTLKISVGLSSKRLGFLMDCFEIIHIVLLAA